MKGRIAGLVLAAALGWPGAALTQDFPTRPVIFVVPFAVGGTIDIQLRALSAGAEKFLGQPIVIENRPSATGTLAPSEVATTAAPDGYTITQIHTGVLRLPFMTKTAYNPETDFTYIIGISGLTAGVVVRNDAPWQTFSDFLADAKANPGKIVYGSPGGATNPYIIMQTIAKRQGIQWTNVPFKSVAESSNALLGGHIQAISDTTGWAPQVNAGKFRLLVTFGAQRTKNWPTVPTLHDLGMDIVANADYGIAGPRGIDPAVVKVLHDAFKKGMEEPSFVRLLDQLDQEPMYRNTQDYQAYIMGEIAQQKRIVEELGLKQN